jgi:hypothetical protein
MSSFSFDQSPSRPPVPAERPPIRWWLVGPLGALMAAVLVRWVSDGGLRLLAADRHGERDPHAALASLKQALLLTVIDVARVLALVLLGVLLLGMAMTFIRLVGRRRWHYRRYAIAPYRTDEASTEQVVALFQDWHQQLHQRLHRRLLFGQPYLALEEHVRPDAGGAEATLAIVCPEQFVAALDGRLAATYPHSRIGHAFSRRFEPLELDIAWRHAIVRLRKHRAFTATVNTDTRQLDEPVIGSELAGMAACGEAVTVQKVLTPILPGFERVARWIYARRERRAGGRGPRRPLGAASPLAQAELRAALEAQQQPLFWLELRVVSTSHAACRMVAGAIAGRRRENVLCQRNTTFTRGLHRRRVDLARPEAISSWRTGVVSAAEAATLWQLPAPRVGHVRLARHTIPRAPAPPDVARAAVHAADHPPPRRDDTPGEARQDAADEAPA